MSIFLSFLDELEKISAKTIPVKGAKGRRSPDGTARVSKPLPEPKEKVQEYSFRKRRFKVT